MSHKSKLPMDKGINRVFNYCILIGSLIVLYLTLQAYIDKLDNLLTYQLVPSLYLLPNPYLAPFSMLMEGAVATLMLVSPLIISKELYQMKDQLILDDKKRPFLLPFVLLVVLVSITFVINEATKNMLNSYSIFGFIAAIGLLVLAIVISIRFFNGNFWVADAILLPTVLYTVFLLAIKIHLQSAWYPNNLLLIVGVSFVLFNAFWLFIFSLHKKKNIEISNNFAAFLKFLIVIYTLLLVAIIPIGAYNNFNIVKTSGIGLFQIRFTPSKNACNTMHKYRVNCTVGQDQTVWVTHVFKNDFYVKNGFYVVKESKSGPKSFVLYKDEITLKGSKKST